MVEEEENVRRGYIEDMWGFILRDVEESGRLVSGYKGHGYSGRCAGRSQCLRCSRHKAASTLGFVVFHSFRDGFALRWGCVSAVLHFKKQTGLLCTFIYVVGVHSCGRACL